MDLKKAKLKAIKKAEAIFDFVAKDLEIAAEAMRLIASAGMMEQMLRRQLRNKLLADIDVMLDKARASNDSNRDIDLLTIIREKAAEDYAALDTDRAIHERAEKKRRQAAARMRAMRARRAK